MNDISVEELHSRLNNHEKLNIVDVREPLEHDMANIGGVLIPLDDLPNQIDQLTSIKQEEIIVYCRSGNRSGRACQFLRDQGFTNVRNLTGGILQWAREIDPNLTVF